MKEVITMQSDQEIVLTVRLKPDTDRAVVAKFQDAVENVVVESNIVASIEWSSFRNFRD